MSHFRCGFLLGSLNGAGAEKTVLTLLIAIGKLGHNVDLFLLNSSGDYDVPENVSCFDVIGDGRRQKRLSLAHLTGQGYDLFITSRAEYYDAINVRNKYCSVHITPTAWLTHPKWQFWNTIIKTHKLARKFQNKQLIALSNGIKRDLIDNLGCQYCDIQVINNPFDIQSIREKAMVGGEFPEGDYIIYVASLIKRKRHDDLLRAFSIIKDKEIKLVLLGKGVLESELSNLALSLGIYERVVFLGWDENPYRFIKQAKLSMLTSEAEGLPRVVVESLIVGTPVVSTDCPSGPAEVLIGDLSKFLTPIGDHVAIAKAMDLALQAYPDLTEDMLNYFDAESVAKRYVELISLLGVV